MVLDRDPIEVERLGWKHESFEMSATRGERRWCKRYRRGSKSL